MVTVTCFKKNGSADVKQDTYDQTARPNRDVFTPVGSRMHQNGRTHLPQA